MVGNLSKKMPVINRHFLYIFKAYSASFDTITIAGRSKRPFSV